jgi:hypothetical protein
VELARSENKTFEAKPDMNKYSDFGESLAIFNLESFECNVD